MTSRARGDQLQSPWESRFADYQDKAITITVTFNNTTRSITGATIVRDAGCQFRKILIGTSADGVPDDTDYQFSVPVGTTSIGKAPFTAFGFQTIEQLQELQITAGR